MPFQYGGRPFSETGSSFILAMDYNISSKIGMRNLNPEIDFRFYGRHLEKSISCHNSEAIVALQATKFGRWMQNDIPITTQIKVETGSTIPIWRPSIFRNEK